MPAPGRFRRPGGARRGRPAVGRPLILAVAVGIAVLLAGCGSSGSAGRAAQPSAGRPVPTAGATAGAPAGPAYSGPVAAPAGEAFYRPPAPLPAGRPGDVLWSRTIPAVGPLAAAHAVVRQVLYLSTDALGAPMAVSGTVLAPAHLAPDAPMLGYAPGTQGLGDTCAPSRGLAVGMNLQLGDVVGALSRGWAVAVTDYQGLGTPGEHTYVVGRAEGHALIDVVRAGTRVAWPGGRTTSPRVGLMGYSQGGGAAAWAGELAGSYAPDVRLVGIAAGGVPADLSALARSLDGRPHSGLGLAAAVGLDAAYPELKLDALLNDRGRTVFAGVRDACAIALITQYANLRFADLTTTDPMTLPAWRARLAENTLGRAVPRVPIYMYHAMSDTMVAFPQAERLRETYCGRGVAVTWVPFPGDHINGVGQGAAALRFLDDRMAGRPTPGNC